MRQNALLRWILFAVVTTALIVPAKNFAAAPPQILTQIPQKKQKPQKPATPPPPPPQYSITVKSQLVQVNTVVTDQDGNIITGLKQQNFRIFDNNQPEPITNFEPNDAPITIVLLMEFSARFGGIFAYYSKYLAYGFADHLGPKDWIAVVTFDLKPHILVDFTHNKQEVDNAILSLYFPGFSESDTYDALINTIDRLKDVPGKKSILLVGTGFDTFSKHTLDQTYNVLKQTNVTVFCVGAAEMLEVANPNGDSITYLQAKNEMNYFAKYTGGLAWFPRFEGEMPGIFNDVVAFLRNQYSLGYVPSAMSRDGKYHKIKVEVVDDKGNPLMIANRKGKMKKVIAYAREGYLATKAPAGS
ncbi:MAG TPA: VWA domain-containing protein [Candidatus Limnocylindrales bacterium]|nr:VWA domain-containing protein [Candidatus Limnocylindrales bacterium]